MWLWDDETNIIQYCLNTTSHFIAFRSVSLKLCRKSVIYTEYPVQFSITKYSVLRRCDWIEYSVVLDNSSRIMRILCICIKRPDWLGERIRSRRVEPRPSRTTLRSRRCKKGIVTESERDRERAERIRRSGPSGFGRLKTKSKMRRQKSPDSDFVSLVIVLRYSPPESPSLRLQEPAVCTILEIRGALPASWFQSLRIA